MADYKAKVTTITQWQRCFRIVLENPRDGVPSIEFLEEEVTVTDGQETRRMVPGCRDFYEPRATVPIRNPNTDALVGVSMPHSDIYAILYSMYRNAADRRDIEQGRVEPPAPTQPPAPPDKPQQGAPQ